MSLKIFHIVFIILSIATSVFVGIWGLANHQPTLGIIFLLLAAGLVAYGFRAFRKLKEIT